MVSEAFTGRRYAESGTVALVDFSGFQLVLEERKARAKVIKQGKVYVKNRTAGMENEMGAAALVNAWLMIMEWITTG